MAARNSSIGASRPFSLDMPEGPAVAGGQALHQRADLVDRADRRPCGERAIGSHESAVAPSDVDQRLARAREPRFDHAREGDARLAPPRRRDRNRLFRQRLDRVDPARAPRRRKPGSRSTPMNERRRRRRRAPVVPEPKNGSSTRSPALEAASSTRISSASGFCVGWVLRPLPSFSRSAPVQIGRNQSERTCTSSLPAFRVS